MIQHTNRCVCESVLGSCFHECNTCILPKLRSFAISSPRLKAVSMSGCMADAAGHVDGAPLEIMDDISSFLSTVFDLRFKPKQLPMMILSNGTCKILLFVFILQSNRVSTNRFEAIWYYDVDVLDTTGTSE